MRRKPEHRGQRGFTLLELLVAITLLGVLMVALFGGLRLGARAWETGEERLDRAARLQVVQDFLRQRLTQTYPARDGISGRRAFQGDRQSVRFVTTLPRHLGAGFHEMVLEVVDGDGDAAPDLVLRWRPFELDTNAPDTVEAPFQQRILLPAIEGLTLAYFGADQPAQLPQWTQSWLERQVLPALILVHVEFAQTDPRRWPDLVVRPMIDRADMLDF